MPGATAKSAPAEGYDAVGVRPPATPTCHADLPRRSPTKAGALPRREPCEGGSPGAAASEDRLTPGYSRASACSSPLQTSPEGWQKVAGGRSPWRRPPVADWKRFASWRDARSLRLLRGRGSRVEGGRKKERGRQGSAFDHSNRSGFAGRQTNIHPSPSLPSFKPRIGSAFASHLLLLILLLPLRLSAQADPPPIESVAYARHAFQDAQVQYQNTPRTTNAAWQFARACFDLAEFATNHAQRAELAQQGIAASQHAIDQDSNSGPAHYYLGLNLGQLARTKNLGALRLVGRMEKEFSLARQLDERFDHAGPDRGLGLLYLDAPTLGSIGSRTKARQHLRRAVELAPDYPENRLNLVEAYVKWSERADAGRELRTLEDQLPAARAAFTGPAWASSWTDWDQRLKKVKKRAEDSSKTLESPRQK